MATLEQLLTTQRPSVGGVTLPPGGVQGLGPYLQTVADNTNQYPAPVGYTIGAVPAPAVSGQTQGYNLAVVPSQAQPIPQVEQRAQDARPTTEIIPAAQVVANTTRGYNPAYAGTAPPVAIGGYSDPLTASIFEANPGATDYPVSPTALTGGARGQFTLLSGGAMPATQPATTVRTPPAQRASVSQAGGASPFSGALTQPVRSAPLTVDPNATTNFFIQNQNPVRTQFGYYGAPETSVGGMLSLASMLGMSPQQLMGGLDAIQGRGVTESPYWQSQYNQALQATSDPSAALAHANLSAVQAGQNTAGLFARTMAAPTQQASQAAADRAYGRTYLDPNAGAAYRGTLSTASLPVGATAAGNVLARTPTGATVTLPRGPYSAANASYANLGAQAVQQAMAREALTTPGSGITRSGSQDPEYQRLRRQQLEIKIQQDQKKLETLGQKDPRIAQAQSILRSLPKDDPRREPYLEFLTQAGEAAGISSAAPGLTIR